MDIFGKVEYYGDSRPKIEENADRPKLVVLLGAMP